MSGPSPFGCRAESEQRGGVQGEGAAHFNAVMRASALWWALENPLF
jgi:hypothetical protein